MLLQKHTKGCAAGRHVRRRMRRCPNPSRPMSTGGSPARRAPVSGRPTPYIRSSEHADRRTSRRKPRSRTSCSRRATRSSRDGWDPHSTARLPTTSMLEPSASSSLTHHPMVRPSRYTSPAVPPRCDGLSFSPLSNAPPPCVALTPPRRAARRPRLDRARPARRLWEPGRRPRPRHRPPHPSPRPPVRPGRGARRLPPL